MLKKMKEKVEDLDKDLRESREVRDKLQCQVNLMKFQVVNLMKELHEEVNSVSDIKVDFKKLH